MTVDLVSLEHSIDADTDGLDIRWRTVFGMRQGLEPLEAYQLALALAGVRGKEDRFYEGNLRRGS